MTETFQIPLSEIDIPQPSESIRSLDDEIKQRYARRTGGMEKFLNEWIKLDESQEKLFAARGTRGENYFQYKLAHHDTEMALALANMCHFFAESTNADQVIEFLEMVDGNGNDLWHYLAGCLTSDESDDALQIAKILIQLEIDFCRKNDEDVSALSKLLLPDVKWRSINSMNQAKQLTIEEIESSFSKQINLNEALKQEIMNNIFTSDIVENNAELTLSVLGYANLPHVEQESKDRALKLIFDYVGGKRRENVFMKVVEQANNDLFELCLDLLVKSADYAVREIAARDLQWAKAAKQIFIYKRLSRINRSRQNAMVRAIYADRPKYVGALISFFTNENMVKVVKDSRGKTVAEEVQIDPRSPAPQNPFLSFILQMDSRANTAFHSCILMGREDCLRKLFHGLSLMDSYMIITRVPNKWGITISHMIEGKPALMKLSAGLKNGKIAQNEAQALAQMMKKNISRDLTDFINDVIGRAEVVFERTGGLSEAKPTFDLTKIPTVPKK